MDDPNALNPGYPQYASMSQEQRQREYSPSSAIGGNYMPFIEQYIAKSEAAYAACNDVKSISYGNTPTQTFDVALPGNAESKAPLFVFIHGGYWQALSKRESFFGAKELTDRGVAYAAIDYTLAPAASLAQIVDECQRAMATIATQSDALGIDTDQVYIAGSSAGAHLSAMCCANENCSIRPAGAVLLSGIYDLEPFVDISDNDAVGLDLVQARQLSPLLLPIASYPDTIVSWGEHETLEFKRQSTAMGSKLVSRDRRVHSIESPSRNHFDVVHDLVDLSTPLGQQVQSLINR
jgi:arylformamidase